MGITEDIFNEVVKEEDIINVLDDDCQRTFKFSLGLHTRFETDRSYPKRLIRMFFKCSPQFNIWKHLIGRSMRSRKLYNYHLKFEITGNITFKQMFDFIRLMENCAFSININGEQFSYQNFKKGYDVLGHPGSVMRCSTFLNKIYPDIEYQKIFAYMMGSHYNHMMFSGTEDLLRKHNCKQFIEKTLQYCENSLSHLKYYGFLMDDSSSKICYQRRIRNAEEFSIILMDSNRGSLQLRNFKKAHPENHLDEYIRDNIEKFSVKRVFKIHFIKNNISKYEYYIAFLGYIYDNEHNEGAFCSMLYNHVFNYNLLSRVSLDKREEIKEETLKKNLEELFETKDERKRRILAESD